MNQRQVMLKTVRALVVSLAFATLARCAEDPASLAEHPVGQVFKWIHFAILAAVLYWLSTKVLPPAFRHNADRISAAITKATALKSEAERQLQEAAAKLANLEKEVAHFRELAQKEAAAEMERLRAMTKIEMEKVGIAAKAEMEAAEHAARVELKALAAKLAVDGAESLVTKQMTPAVQEAMVSNFVRSLQGRPN